MFESTAVSVTAVSETSSLNVSAESPLADPSMQESFYKPKVINEPYYDDPEAMPDLSNYYAETHRGSDTAAASSCTDS